jgi:di/tricarboxylate transporter
MGAQSAEPVLDIAAALSDVQDDPPLKREPSHPGRRSAMSPDILVVSLILAAAIVLLVTERLPVDVTGLGIMVALMAAGLLAPAEAVAGFANPAPLAVGALFVVSRGLVRTGALAFVTRLTITYTNGSAPRLLLLSLVLVGTLSAFMNNTPVVVLFMSILMAVCVRYGFAPSKFLIPLSYISIMAGTCTLIGTSTNILVSDVAAGLGNRPIGMFELSVLGVPIALAGGAFMFLFSGKLLPKHTSPAMDAADHAGLYLSELKVTDDSGLIETHPGPGLGEAYPDVRVYEIFRNGRILDPRNRQITLRAGDEILARGSASDISAMLERGDATLPSCSRDDCFESPHQGTTRMVELLVPSGSSALGFTLDELPLTNSDDVNILGFKRRNAHYSWHSAHLLRLRVGDILLAQVAERMLARIRKDEEFMILNDDVVSDVVNWKRAPLALGIFALMIAAATTGLADILTASFAAALAMILAGCLKIREAYRALDVKVLMLIIGTIALGSAMQKTGADTLYAGAFLSLFQGAGPHVVLTGLILLTSLLSHFLSNNSVAVLLVPVGLATAASLGVDPRPFIIGIAFGASACYATPIGYQTNLIVYGPGGYAFTDFMRLGLPMVAIVCGGAALFIPAIWPF